MSQCNAYRPGQATMQHLHAIFQEAILPHVQSHARVLFRHLGCPHRRADAIAEAVALAWAWFVRLDERGKDATRWPTALATFAAKAVRSGRRLAGPERPQDALSPRAQQAHRFRAEPLPASTRAPHETLYGAPHGQRSQDAFEERLRDNTQTPVPEQVSFRLDFPAWLRTRSDRDRLVIEDLMAGERTGDVAARHGLTAGRVSQLRRQFCEDWARFLGEAINQGLAQTVNEVNQGLRSRLHLDGQAETPALPGPVLDASPEGNGHPVAKRGRRSAD